MSGLFGQEAESRGNSEGSGTQGVTSGNATQGSPIGTGGIGSYDLGGRSLGSGGLVQPRYTVNDEGTVVIDITVDPSGNVIRAEIGRGTNTPNTTLRNEALRAARSTKFNAITSMNNQQGTITYRFRLN
jgi:TonB family protein